MTSSTVPVRVLASALGALLLGSCQSMYYSTMSRFGVDKRDILVERTEKAGESMAQLAASIQTMASAYRETINAQGAGLPELHEGFTNSYGNAEDATEDFHESIEDMQSVADALFEHWKDETEEIMDSQLRRESLDNFGMVQASYTKLVRTMRNVETALEPLMTRFHDHVVFLRLNLHRLALASLQENQDALFAEVTGLDKLLQSAMEETRAFAERIDY